MRYFFMICALAFGSTALVAQTTPAQNTNSGSVNASKGPNLDIPQTLAYINEKIKDFTDKPENIRKIKLTREGVIEERFGTVKTHFYYLDDIASVNMEILDAGVFRVRLECKQFESSCISSSDETEIMKHHTNFYIVDRREAENLQKAWIHLKNIAKDEVKNSDPFANFDTGTKPVEDPKNKKKKKKKKK